MIWISASTVVCRPSQSGAGSELTSHRGSACGYRKSEYRSNRKKETERKNSERRAFPAGESIFLAPPSARVIEQPAGRNADHAKDFRCGALF
jgi:hypothetical protein